MNNNRDLSVLHLASGDLWAGAEVQMFSLVRILHAMPNVSASVILLNHGTLEKKLRKAGINVTVHDESEFNSFQILAMLVKTIREINPDVVHTHRAKENVLGSIASIFAGNIPSIRTVHGNPRHGPYLKRLPQRLISFLDFLCGRYIQKYIVAVSDDLGNILARLFPKYKIYTIVNGIDHDATLGAVFSRDPMPTSGGNTFRIGIAGRLVAVKRVDLFIMTACYVIDHCPNLNPSFHIFGDGPMREVLENLSKDLDADSIIHFEGHCEDILQRLLTLDLLLMTSDHEGLPMILLEAMALQVPIIAHAVGGIPDLLGQGTCGVLVYEHSVSGYGKELCRLVESRRILIDNSSKALERVTTKYSAKQNAKAYLSIYSVTRRAQG